MHEQGTALADVLCGDYNPAGRLNKTWPKALDQLPPMMDYDIHHGRTYIISKGSPSTHLVLAKLHDSQVLEITH
jgi:beta-glucosidase